MGKIIAGIGTSHVPSIGGAYDRGAQAEPDWKPLFDAYVPVREWLADLKPDIAIMVYNDHGADFFFKQYPTFAVGCADQYAIADEGMGIRPLPRIKGDFEFSRHLCESLVYDEFDLTLCQEMAVEHGFLVPMHLCFDPSPDWNVAAVPLAVNVLLHPLPTAMRCFKLGQAIRRAVEADPRDLRVVILGTGGMSHQLQGMRAGLINPEWDKRFLDSLSGDAQLARRIPFIEYVREAGSEGIEMVMWLISRGALEEKVREVYRFYHVPASNTALGHLILENESFKK
jgi:hypothetical protein